MHNRPVYPQDTWTLFKLVLAILTVLLALFVIIDVCAQSSDLPIARLIIFHSPTCPHCREVLEHTLPPLQSRYGDQLSVRLYDTTTPEGSQVYLLLHQRYPQLPQGVPQGYIGQSVIIGSDQFRERLPGLIDDCLARGGTDWPFSVARAEDASNVQRQTDALAQTAEAEMKARFASMGVLTVAIAGFLDGINPCAFTTLIFFVSYLALMGRGRQEILGVGLAFTLAVFLSYLAMGLGLAQIIQSLSGLGLIGRIVYGVSIGLCVILAVLSLADFVRVKQGRETDIILQLPRVLKRRIHEVVRRQSRVRAYVFGAFLTGVVISVFELACTGQVYFPTLIFMSGLGETRLPALLYLVLYNTMFVVPLVAVFGLAYIGTTHQQFAAFFHSHMATVKLLTAGLFVLLAIWLGAVLPSV